ncbi:LacI family DNA-binding transcriptional regulator [Microbacterium sp. SORGH_AS_0862]|uniref:LacI family DNA-binding transcriptional regulator n=1 Tax=Microbacterium sp. SORGH_AS_0862 TaxID=3041789 RepID=UPI00278F3C8E|nr:LacI family DNA-binding transcriptional regulator [Microbacterium sp. SORGH_AS_0862]MDQ1204501.1 DNA-binding LacI/PurR family transcriptional regulator [Microbacterium sp. SORGH_AS_0862]
MQQIARIAGVSVTTVSHVLSGNRPVSPRTAERVHAVIQQYDYVPVSAARRLKNGRGGLIALVVPDLTVSYFAHVAKGVERAADAAGLGVIVCSVSTNAPRRHLDLVRDGTVDGIVHLSHDPQIDREIVALSADYPVVIADEALATATSIPTVTADNLRGGRLLGEHLAELGHRQALIIAGPESLGSSSLRVVGIRESFPTALVLRGDFTAESGYRLVGEALASGLTFTCVATGNDDQALGVLRRLREAGIDVPHEMSVTGFDDGIVADALGLTTVHQPAIEMGVRACELLIELIDSAETAEARSDIPPELIPVELRVRRTTARASSPA